MTARIGKPDRTGRSSGKIAGRRGRQMKPPKGEPWVWLTRELLLSDAFRSLGIHARRFIDALLVEHMNHAGTENGNLKATYGQLTAAGRSSRRDVVRGIAEAEEKGLVDCRRAGMRVATTYTLTWLPSRDGSPATNRWKGYQIQKSGTYVGTSQVPTSVPESTKLVPTSVPVPSTDVGTPSISTRRVTRNAKRTNGALPTGEVIE